ncbi:hypothetical protein M758_12G002800 [Ceratodon purpureus]|nr:hypothetical protein M758_12G002800 [Ceratodon purpureus]KAG0597537.1 hypothetical protein M758_12G002800 [Ceratodon purpureus]KAG0597538.1 hypothetical protein M758_12G002800 [Ceratodon purpureus]
MSPTSPVYYPKVEEDLQNGGHSSGLKLPSTFPFGIRTKPPKHPEKISVSALKVCNDSHRIRKPPRPLPQVQYRAPLIIHTYSPKVIHTDPDDFMSLVQQLTGSSDTCLRLKRKPSKKSSKRASSPKPPPVPEPKQPQGEDLNCGSPSSSQDSGVFASTSGSVDPKTGKQSNSPRGPLSNFEFDNTFTEVKSEPAQFDNSFNFYTGLKPLPKPASVETGYSLYHGIDINSPLPSPGFISPGWLPELSPGTAAWSQAFLDCLNGSPRLAEQPPLQRQKAYSSGHSPKPSEGTMVALESIQAFMMK